MHSSQAATASSLNLKSNFIAPSQLDAQNRPKRPERRNWRSKFQHKSETQCCPCSCCLAFTITISVILSLLLIAALVLYIVFWPPQNPSFKIVKSQIVTFPGSSGSSNGTAISAAVINSLLQPGRPTDSLLGVNLTISVENNNRFPITIDQGNLQLSLGSSNNGTGDELIPLYDGPVPVFTMPASSSKVISSIFLNLNQVTSANLIPILSTAMKNCIAVNGIPVTYNVKDLKVKVYFIEVNLSNWTLQGMTLSPC